MVEMPSQNDLDVIETTVQKTYSWINDLREALGGVPRRDAYQVLRSFLHVLRDRLTIEEVAQLGAQLPMLIRGLYYEGWDPSKNPVKMKPDEFIERFIRGLTLDEVAPKEALRAAARTLRQHITEGEFEDVLALLPAQLRELLD
jgi:uncharacterized protein (DUF2267 family)